MTAMTLVLDVPTRSSGTPTILPLVFSWNPTASSHANHSDGLHGLWKNASSTTTTATSNEYLGGASGFASPLWMVLVLESKPGSSLILDFILWLSTSPTLNTRQPSKIIEHTRYSCLRTSNTCGSKKICIAVYVKLGQHGKKTTCCAGLLPGFA